MTQFLNNIEKLWGFEDKVKETFKPSVAISGMEYFDAVRRLASEDPNCMKVREEIGKTIPLSKKISEKNNININILSLPPPAIPNAKALPVNLFEAVLHDISYNGIDRLLIRDKINGNIGACEERKQSEFRKLINPFYLFWVSLQFILKIPFYLISATGFNVDKIEDHLLGRLIKIVELGLLIYFGLKFGLSKSDILQLFK